MKKYTYQITFVFIVIILTAGYLRTSFLAKQPAVTPSALVQKITKNIDEHYGDWSYIDSSSYYYNTAFFVNKKCPTRIQITTDEENGIQCDLIIPTKFSFSKIESTLILEKFKYKQNMINYFIQKKRNLIEYYIRQAKEKEALSKICQ